MDALAQITGQKPVVTKARQSIAGFKLRERMAIGCKVTLRGVRMYEFLDRLISLALPRVRDFRGLNPNAFDGHGNYSLGLSEQLVFPELNPDKFTRPQGMNVTMVTSTDSNDEARELLQALGMPMRASGTKDAAETIREGPSVDGKQIEVRHGAAEAEVLHPRQAAVPALRPAAGRVSQVRLLPDLLPQPGRQRTDSRREEGELVKG